METNRFNEKKNYINIKLDQILKCFNEGHHTKEFEIKIYDDEKSFNKVVDITILKEKKYQFKFNPDIHIKRIDKKFRELANLILI